MYEGGGQKVKTQSYGVDLRFCVGFSIVGFRAGGNNLLCWMGFSAMLCYAAVYFLLVMLLKLVGLGDYRLGWEICGRYIYR